MNFICVFLQKLFHFFGLFFYYFIFSEIQDEKERVQAIYAVIEKLPKPNYDLLERLIFHLARIANNEALNKMSPNGLAIIFAPALLRTNKKLQAQDSLNQVPRQTAYVYQFLSILGGDFCMLHKVLSCISFAVGKISNIRLNKNILNLQLFSKVSL
jgi:hypothetical protein